MARILVSGSRSLDERRHDPAVTSARVLRECREARERFIAHLEDAVGELVVSDEGLGSVTVVHGDARHGADNWADRWLFDAWDAGKFRRDTLHVERWPAKWGRSGAKLNLAAGMERNAKMVATMSPREPHLVLVCWDGHSRGTGNLLDRALVAGLKTRRTWL